MPYYLIAVKKAGKKGKKRNPVALDDLKILEADNGFCQILRKSEMHGLKRKIRRASGIRWRKEKKRFVPVAGLTKSTLVCIIWCIIRHQRRCIMRTNIVLDDVLVEEAMILSGARTKRELISNALREFVTTRKRLNLLDLDGKIKFSKDYDYKRLRERR